jgi:hypothetical protein
MVPGGEREEEEEKEGASESRLDLGNEWEMAVAGVFAGCGVILRGFPT